MYLLLLLLLLFIGWLLLLLLLRHFKKMATTTTTQHASILWNSLQNVEKQGYLKKRGDMLHSWRNRYFVLKDSILFYFVDASTKEPRYGKIILTQKKQGACLYCKTPKWKMSKK